MAPQEQRAPARPDGANQATATVTVLVTTTRRLSYGTIQMTTDQSPVLARTATSEHDDTVALCHEQQCPDSRPLLQQQAPHHLAGSSVSLLLSPKGGSAMEEKGNGAGSFAHFRYIVGSLVLLAVFLYNYANYTMYIAAIEMVSNDVIQSGMTELRAKHLSADPLAVDRNAAAPGTCPVESEPVLLSQFEVDSDGGPLLNASQISILERIALHEDITALLASVSEREANGQLVNWSISERSYIFMAHNLGGILLAVPINRLGLIYGPKLMIFVCVLTTGLRMLLFPLIASQTPFWATFAFELVVGGPGASIGILAYPLVSVWMQPDEANFFMVIGGIVTLLATASTNFLSTQLLAQHIDWSWCFYLPGIASIGTALVWLVFGADRPSESGFVTRAELELLTDTIANRTQRKLAQTQLNQRQTNNNNYPSATQNNYESCFCVSSIERYKCAANKSKRQPNWSTIFTCPTVWALIASHFAFHWNSKIATLWPTYFTNILHLDAATIGILTGVKGIVALIFGTLFSLLTRKLVLERPFGISLTAYRRVNQLIATLVLIVSVALMVLMDCDFWANAASVMLTPVVTSFNAISNDQMPLDLSAEDSGLLVSVIRLLSMGDIPALPVSSFVLSFAPDALAGDRLTWRLVWLLGLAIKMCTCLLFVAVAKSEPKSYSRLVPAGPCRSSGVC